jgi:signal peptidase I
MRNLSRLQNNLLTLGAVLGTLCLLGALTGILFGAKPLIFRSGSMSPSIATGALGVSLPVEAQAIRTGDIISVENAAGVRITHRVVASATSNGTATVTLKGDSNAVADLEPYVLRKADRVIFSVPLLGYGVAWLSSSAAVFVGGLVTAYLLYLAFGSRPGKRREVRLHNEQPRKNKNDPDAKAGRRSKRIAATTLVSIVLLPVGALNAATPGQAAFLDAAVATANFTATTLQAPILTCANSGLNNVTLTLTHPGDFSTLYELRTLVPAKLWGAASWQPGTPVTATIDADDAAFTFSGTTDVVFLASAKFGAWVSAPASKSVRYSPPTGVLFIDLVPARLRCL